MLHRQEPAMLHQGEVQTLCEITMKYHGPNLTLPRDQYDPTQNISIDQQHCGGNTLTVFKENLKPGGMFISVAYLQSKLFISYTFKLDVVWRKNDNFGILMHMVLEILMIKILKLLLQIILFKDNKHILDYMIAQLFFLLNVMTLTNARISLFIWLL